MHTSDLPSAYKRLYDLRTHVIHLDRCLCMKELALITISLPVVDRLPLRLLAERVRFTRWVINSMHGIVVNEVERSRFVLLDLFAEDDSDVSKLADDICLVAFDRALATHAAAFIEYEIKLLEAESAKES